jgi:alkylation response protein AidB-like acyl-CoA dehydrogenase
VLTTANGVDRETLELTLASLREFARDHLDDRTLLDLDARDECPVDLVRAMCGERLGIHLLFLPEAYHGMGGDALDVARVCEAMGAIDLGVATAVLATLLGSDPIRIGGTAEQKTYWLTRIADEGLLFAYGATEPEAGSDLAALRTAAEPLTRDGRVEAYRLSGAKQWISNGGIADFCVILALAPGGPSWFIVERGAPGFTSNRPENKHGIRASNTAALALDGVVVSADRLVGGVEGQGLIQALAVFGYTRLMVAAFALGAGWAALDRAVPYSVQRIQAGGPLSEKQAYTNKLIVPHAARLEAARALIEDAAERLSLGETGLLAEGAIAKYFASEVANASADAAIQAFGGYGYTREFVVEKIKRDLRITTIYEGTSEILEATIGRDRWQQHLKTRGEWYRDRAARLEALEARMPQTGARTAAMAARALGQVFEDARQLRLTRHPHVQFRLGELAAWAEAAEAMAVRASRALANDLPDKADRRFGARDLCALSRVFAREAALKVATDGARWILGSADVSASPPSSSSSSMPLALAAQAGLLSDMALVKDAVYQRLAATTR